jgi:hypothetical protein
MQKIKEKGTAKRRHERTALEGFFELFEEFNYPR